MQTSILIEETAMRINEIDLLLTYKCNLECDHCFVFGSPEAKGVMKIADIRKILGEAKKVRSVDWIYFEGGEPVLYYPILLWGLREARKLGFKTGFITNAYWATSLEDAREWLKPISKIGISDAIVSNDLFHHGEDEENLSEYASQVARELGIPVSNISIAQPKEYGIGKEWKGKPITDEGVLFKGRPAEKLVADLPRRPW